MSELKKKLIEEIEKIEDILILKQLTSLIKESDQTIEVEFTDSQLKTLKESQSQVENGQFHEHNDVIEMLKNA